MPVNVQIAQEIYQTHDKRGPLLKEWQDLTGRYPLTYFANFYDEYGVITDEDVDLIQDILSNLPSAPRLDLIIESPGGLALSAERLVKTCRTFTTDFRVVVPRRAKSAATMVAMGARSILMGPAAELGPIDPQVFYLDRQGRRQFISIDALLSGFEQLLEKFETFKGTRVEGLLMMMPPFDQAAVEQLIRDKKLAEQLALQWCAEMPRHKGKSERAIRKAIKIFVDPSETYSHGRPIDIKRAQEAGLPATAISKDDPLWSLLQQICIRSAVNAGKVAKAIETTEATFFSQRQPRPAGSPP